MNVTCNVIAITLLPLNIHENVEATAIHLNLTEKEIIGIVEGEMKDMHQCMCAYATVEVIKEVVNEPNAQIDLTEGGITRWLNNGNDVDTGFVIVDQHLDSLYRPRYWDVDEYGDWAEKTYYQLVECKKWLLRL